jgi:HPt (histidine-containing phosphotransfer) domain-containing protein
LTANAVSGDRDRCLECGMNDYISKPISIRELEKLMDKWSKVVEKKGSNLKSRNPSMPALDPAILADLKDLDNLGEGGLFQELSSIFLSTVPDRVEKMIEALAEGKFKLIQSEAHQLKSSSGNLGAVCFSKLCRELEGLAIWDPPTVAQDLLNRIRAECERVCDSLKAEMKKVA